MTAPMYDTDSRFTEHLKEQRRVVRDALAGDLAVQARGRDYLGIPSELKADDFFRYLRRGKFYPVPRNTLSTLVGTAMSKPPEIELPARLEPMRRTCGVEGAPMVNVLEEALSEALSMGQIGLLLLRPPGGANTRCRIATYAVESIVEEPTMEWRDGVLVLTKVKLRDGQKQVDDGVRDIDLTLYLSDEDEGRCWIKRSYWDKDTQSERFVSDQRYDVGAFPLKFIPFIFASYDGVTPRLVSPPFYQISRLAIQAFGTSCEKNNLLFVAGWPQYWVSGPISDDQAPQSTGPGQIWVLPPDTTVGREQADAGAARVMQEEIDVTVLQMLQMASSFMSAGSKDGASASTNRDVATMKLRGQLSLLHQTVANVEEAFKRLLEWAVMFDYGTTMGGLADGGQQAMDAIKFRINREWLDTGVQPALLKTLLDTVAMGHLSPRALYAVLERSGLTLPGVDFDEDQSEVESDNSLLRPPTDPPTIGE